MFNMAILYAKYYDDFIFSGIILLPPLLSQQYIIQTGSIFNPRSSMLYYVLKENEILV